MVRFFCSRLRWSRWAVVDLVPNQVAETLVRTQAGPFVAFGGMPLVPRCSTCPQDGGPEPRRRGDRWTPTFAYAVLELGFTADVCKPRRAPTRRGRSRTFGDSVKGRSSNSAGSKSRPADTRGPSSAFRHHIRSTWQ